MNKFLRKKAIIGYSIFLGIIVCGFTIYALTIRSKNTYPPYCYAFLLSFKDNKEQIKTYYVVMENGKLEIKNSLPFVPISKGSDMYYLALDTLSTGKVDDLDVTSTCFRIFNNIDSAFHFTKSYNFPATNETEEEEQTIDDEPKDSAYEEESEHYYDVSDVQLICFYEGYFTFYFSGGNYSGGAHPNSYQIHRSISVDNLVGMKQLTFETYDNNGTDSYEPDIDLIFSRFGLKDISVADSLEQKVKNGDFIDLVDEDKPGDYKGFYSLDDQIGDWHTILFRNGNYHPYWVAQLDVSAAYMSSGDYALTVEQDLGEVAAYKQCKGYNLQFDNKKLLVKFVKNSLIFYDKTHHKLDEMKIPANLKFLGEQSALKGTKTYEKWEQLFDK